MNEEKNVVKAIQMDGETLEKFKTLCSEFTNQGECMQQLIAVYELNQAKGVLCNQESNVADFQSHLDGLLQGYLHSLELNVNAENRIRMEFSQQLTSKDKTIADLQARLEKSELSFQQSKLEVETVQSQLESLRSEHIQNVAILTDKLTTANDKVNSLTTTANDRQTIIDSLNLQLATTTAQIDEATRIKANYTTVQEQLQHAQDEVTALETQLVNQKEKAEHDALYATKEAEMNLKEAVLVERSKYQDRISELMEQVQTLTQRNGELVNTVADLKTQVAQLSIVNEDNKSTEADTI